MKHDYKYEQLDEFGKLGRLESKALSDLHDKWKQIDRFELSRDLFSSSIDDSELSSVKWDMRFEDELNIGRYYRNLCMALQREKRIRRFRGDLF